MGNVDNDVAPEEGMCCSNACKVRAQCWTKWTSILIFVLSIVAGVYGFVSINGTNFTPITQGYVNWKVPSNAAFGYALIIAAILGAAVAILGFCAAQTLSYCCAIPLGIITFIVGLIFFIAGLAVLALNVGQIIDNQVCSGINGKDWFQAQYATAVDRVMCTQSCPCASTNQAT